MTHVLGLYTGVVFEREEKKWLPLARAFLSIQLVKVQNKHELVYRVWAYQDEKLKIEMRILASLKVSRQETFVRMVDEAFQETMGIRFKTKDMANQFFDDVRDVIRKAPAKELVDLPEGHDAKLGVPEETVKLKVHLPADAKGKERKCYVKVDRRTTMGQLLAAIRKSSKVDNPNAWIEIRPNRYNPLPPHFTVSSSVGNLNIREIWVVHNKGPPIPPAIKVTCHLPVGNKVVMEMSPHITIKEMFIYLCDKYKLDKMMHSIVSRNNKTQLLDMTTTVIGSQVLEFVIIRQKYPVKAHEFWGDEKEWADCGDCGFEGLPYTREWYKQRHAERIPPDEDLVPKRDSTSREERIQGSQFIRETREEAEPSKSPLRDTIGRIKEHVRSLKKNKLYPNPGPMSGGDIPESSGDFSKMRRHWTPPKRDTIQDIEFEKAKAMFEQNRNPLSGNSHLYPNMPELPEPLTAKPEIQTSNQTPPASNPETQTQHLRPTPHHYPGGPGAAPQYSGMGYPPNPMFGGMFQGGMMDMWGNRLPAPYYPNFPMFGGYPSPYPPQHPTPGVTQAPPQPPPQQGPEDIPPHQQSCSITKPGGCSSNPADPLPGQSLNPVSAHGKSRPAPPPPGRPTEEDTPVVQVSQLYPKLEEQVGGGEEAAPGMRRSFKRSSIRSVGGSMRNRANNRSVRFLDSRRDEIPLKIGRDINTLVKEADNDESIVTPRTIVPETESLYPSDISLPAENKPPLTKGDHISTLLNPNLGLLDKGERISNVVERADSPPPERVEDTRYPNLRRMSEAVLPTGDSSNFYPNLHEIQPRRRLRSSLRKKPVPDQEAGDTDDEIAEYTRSLTQQIMNSRSPAKPTTADLKRQLASEIEEAIRQKKLLRGDLRKRRPNLQRSLSEHRAGRPQFPSENGAHSDDDWWFRKGRSRGPVMRSKSGDISYQPFQVDESSSYSSSDNSSDSGSDSSQSDSSSESSVSLTEEFIMKKVKEYLARRKKNKQKKEEEYYSESSESSETEDEHDVSKTRNSQKSDWFQSDSNEEGLLNTLAKHFRKGSTRLKRSVADSLAGERVLEKVVLPSLQLEPHQEEHSVWEHLTDKELEDTWSDHFRRENAIDEEFKSEIDMLKHHLSDEEEEEKENEHPNRSSRKPSFFSRILKKRPKYSFPRFSQPKEEEYEEVTKLAYIPSRENSVKRKNSSVKLQKLPKLALRKNREFRSLQDIRDLNRELEHVNDMVRASSLDFDLSKKPGQTATGYLTGHPLFKKLKRSLSGSLNRSGSLRSLFGPERSKGFGRGSLRSVGSEKGSLRSRGSERGSLRSKGSEKGSLRSVGSGSAGTRVCVDQGEGEACVTLNNTESNYERDVRDMNLSQLLDKYNPEFIRRSLENLY